jgi:transcriptional regulator with XRE-family HTH domain
MGYEQSLGTEIFRTRMRLKIGQIRLAKLLNVKLHRLSDLERGRSFANPLEEQRLRRNLEQLRSQGL